MVKHTIIIAIIFLLVVSGGIYWFTSTSSAQLAEPVKIQKEKDDFVLRVRVEKKDKGFRVLCSLENSGEETVTIHHRTPLISVSINQDNHDFTGSPVTKEMNSRDVYHPEDPRTFTSLSKGEHVLHIRSQFHVNGEVVTINATERIVFQ